MARRPMYPHLAVAAVVAAILIARGSSLVSLLPFALLLGCPLMMVFMMRGMNSHSTEDHTGHGCEPDPPVRTRQPLTIPVAGLTF